MEESVGVGLSDLQLNGFVEHFASFRDQFSLLIVALEKAIIRLEEQKDTLKGIKMKWRNTTIFVKRRLETTD